MVSVASVGGLWRGENVSGVGGLRSSEKKVGCLRHWCVAVV